MNHETSNEAVKRRRRGGKKESLAAKDLLRSNDKKNRWPGLRALGDRENRGVVRPCRTWPSLVRVKGDVSPSIFSIPSPDYNVTSSPRVLQFRRRELASVP